MKDSKTQTFSVEPTSTITIESTSGDLSVHGLDDQEVRVRQKGGEANVQVRDGGLLIRPLRGGSHDLCVGVPRGSTLHMRTASGDVDIADVCGDIDVQTMSGDIDVAGSEQRLDLHSVSGDIAVVADRASALKINTVSGDATYAGALDDEGEYSLNTVSGALRLELGPDQRCTLEFRSLSGRLRCELPNVRQQHGWKKQGVDVNGGGVTVVAHSTSGDIDVREGASDPRPRHDTPQTVAEPVAVHAAALESVGEAPPRDTRPLYAPEVEAEPFGLDDASPDETDSASDDRMRILKEIESGRLTVSEGLERLRNLE